MWFGVVCRVVGSDFLTTEVEVDVICRRLCIKTFSLGLFLSFFSANFILRDVVDGKLVLSFRPPPRELWREIDAPQLPDADADAHVNAHAEVPGAVAAAAGRKKKKRAGKKVHALSDSDSG